MTGYNGHWIPTLAPAARLEVVNRNELNQPLRRLEMLRLSLSSFSRKKERKKTKEGNNLWHPGYWIRPSLNTNCCAGVLSVRPLKIKEKNCENPGKDFHLLKQLLRQKKCSSCYSQCIFEEVISNLRWRLLVFVYFALMESVFVTTLLLSEWKI